MKRILCAIVLVFLGVSLAWASVEINAENFPDDNFRSYVSEEFDHDKDGELSDAEISNVTLMNVYSYGISTLRGIEYFTALTYLACGSNQLTELDVSNNTALTYLNCGYNPFKEFSKKSVGNQLTELDVSNNTALTYLDCRSNQLTELDVSNNIALRSLYCCENRLTELDLSNNTALRSLYCFENRLTELDLSNNIALTSLDCGSNQLTKLDVSNSDALTYLNCGYSPFKELIKEFLKKSVGNQLTELDVSNNIALTHLDCISNQLTKLDVSNNTALTELDCWGNKLTELDVSNNTALTHLDCSDNRLTTLDLSNNTDLIGAITEAQNIVGLRLNTNNDGTYYIELMNSYGLTYAKLSRIIAESVKGYDSNDNNVLIHYNTASGVANFKERPVRFCYIYDTDLVSSAISYDSMDVTIGALPEIMTDKPDDAYVSRKYSFAFSVLGAGNIKWSIDDDSKLPQGLTFNASSGTIKGTPQTTGEYKFRLTAKSSIGSDTKEFTLKVRPSSESPESPVIITLNSDIPEGYVNKKYSFKFEASKSSGLTWSIDKGEVPGLSMSENGRLSGTPSQTGSFDITVSVKDSKGGVDTKGFTVSVKQQEPSPNDQSSSSGGGGGCTSGTIPLFLVLIFLAFLPLRMK